MSISIKSDEGEKTVNTPKKSVFNGIGKSFRPKIDTVKEYEILDENEDQTGDFFHGMPFGLNYDEYTKAQNLKRT